MEEITNSDEGFRPISEVLEEKSGKASMNWLDSEKLVYAGVAVVAIVALVVFFYSVTLPIAPEGLNDVKDVPRLDLEYSIELENGTVIDSGKEAFLLGYVGESLGLSSKVDDGLEGLEEGDEVELLLEAKEAFGDYDEENIVEINRTEVIKRKGEVDKLLTLPLGGFSLEFGEDPVPGKEYVIEGVPWKYIVDEVTASEVVLSQEVEVGQIVPISDIFFLVVSEVFEDHFVTLMTAENQTIDSDNGELVIAVLDEEIRMTLNPVVGQEIMLGLNPLPGKVLSFTSEKIKIDYNSGYIGKDVVFKAKIL